MNLKLQHTGVGRAIRYRLLDALCVWVTTWYRVRICFLGLGDMGNTVSGFLSLSLSLSPLSFFLTASGLSGGMWTSLTMDLVAPPRVESSRTKNPTPVSPALQGRFFTTGPPGKSQYLGSSLWSVQTTFHGNLRVSPLSSVFQGNLGASPLRRVNPTSILSLRELLTGYPESEAEFSDFGSTAPCSALERC